MKKRYRYLLLPLLSLGIFYCSQQGAEEAKILARINDYTLTLNDFESQLTAELELDKDFKLTKEAKKEFLEGLIEKELLIQEAKRLQLDRKERFIKAIERYWESTLIRDLMELKGEEITQRAYISQEETEAYYKELQRSREPIPPLKELEEEIIKELKESKKTRMLDEWISDLRKKARIEINQQLL